jgi:hypothetical protein
MDTFENVIFYEFMEIEKKQIFAFLVTYIYLSCMNNTKKLQYINCPTNARRYY